MQWRLRPDGGAASQARRDAVRWLGAAGIGPVDDVAVVIAELLANAIRVASKEVVLEVTLAPGEIHLCVGDDGVGFTQLPPEVLPPFDAEGSRGLYLVRKLSQGFAVETNPSGTVVRCWLPVSRVAAPDVAGHSASASRAECRPAP